MRFLLIFTCIIMQYSTNRCYAQNKNQLTICGENILNKRSCYTLTGKTDVLYERKSYNTYIAAKGSYKKLFKTIKIQLESNIVMLKRSFDSIPEGHIKISNHHLNNSDFLQLSRVEYLDSIYKMDSLGNLILPYFGGEIKIFKFETSENITINPGLNSNDPFGPFIGDKKFNSFEVLWGSNKPATSKSKVVKFKKKNGKYVLKAKRLSIDEWGNSYYHKEKIYFVENLNSIERNTK